MLWVKDAWAQAEVAELARGAEAELGWVLDPKYGGRGYATEAVQTLNQSRFEALHRLGGVAAAVLRVQDPAQLGLRAPRQLGHLRLRPGVLDSIRSPTTRPSSSTTRVLASRPGVSKCVR